MDMGKYSKYIKRKSRLQKQKYCRGLGEQAPELDCLGSNPNSLLISCVKENKSAHMTHGKT